ncbi:MAG: PKD domain-containing protein [Leptolyngbya sp. SIO1D8]|nr:PKD domain-containing protein [Leptolyngbya sp. SIO1D8]
MDFNAVFDVTYIFKARIETVDTGTDFRMKIWDAAQSEPAEWTLETVDTDFKGLEKGSALFVAHHVDVSFGDFTVVPLNDYPPIVSFDPTSNNEEPLKIDLDASASVDPDGNIASYEWDFGDGNSGSGVTASHTYDAHGDYTITLTITDDDGLKSSTSFLFIPFQDLTFQSDDFNVETLNEEIWKFEDERGNATKELTGFDTGSATFDLTIPGDNEHSLWFDDSSAPRLMQRVNDEDFEVELKFEPTFSDKFQIQGIMVEGLSGKVIRYDFFYDGVDIRNFAATMTMNTTSVDIQYNAAVSKDLESDLFLKVKREGDDWTLYYALSEGNWVESSSFTYPMEVRAVGVFGGNEKPDENSDPPGHKVVVDYFFNSASPIDPEDGEEMVTGIDDKVIKDDEPVLFQNYPNPVSESTHLEFSLPEAGSVSLSINDYLGRKVSEIVREDMSSGKHIISWSPENLKNGLYYGQLEFRSKVKSKQVASTIKIIVLK